MTPTRRTCQLYELAPVAVDPPLRSWNGDNLPLPTSCEFQGINFECQNTRTASTRTVLSTDRWQISGGSFRALAEERINPMTLPVAAQNWRVLHQVGWKPPTSKYPLKKCISPQSWACGSLLHATPHNQLLLQFPALYDPLMSPEPAAAIWTNYTGFRSWKPSGIDAFSVFVAWMLVFELALLVHKLEITDIFRKLYIITVWIPKISKQKFHLGRICAGPQQWPQQVHVA